MTQVGTRRPDPRGDGDDAGDAPAEARSGARRVARSSWRRRPGRPAAATSRPISFVVVTDRDQMARLAEPWRVVCDFYLATFATVGPDHMSEERYDRLKDALRFQAEHFHETPGGDRRLLRLRPLDARGCARSWRHSPPPSQRWAPRRGATMASGLRGVQRALGGGERVPRRAEPAARRAGARPGRHADHLAPGARVRVQGGARDPALGQDVRDHPGRLAAGRLRAGQAPARAAEVIHRDRW